MQGFGEQVFYPDHLAAEPGAILLFAGNMLMPYPGGADRPTIASGAPNLDFAADSQLAAPLLFL